MHIMYITHIIYITDITYISQIIYMTHITCITHIAHITHITYITHTIKLIFKTYKKVLFTIFLLHTKMTNNYYQRHKEKL